MRPNSPAPAAAVMPGRRASTGPGIQPRPRTPSRDSGLAPLARPGTTRRGAAALLAGLAALALAGCAGDVPPPEEPSFYRNLTKGAELDPVAAASMISGYRKNNGLGAVEIDPTLMRLANEQATVMAQKNKLDHAAGRDFKSRMMGSGFDAGIAVENVSAGYHTLAEAFSGWRDSPPHRANMLEKHVSRMGIAAVYAPGTKYKVFWALILAAPDKQASAAGPTGEAPPHQWGVSQQWSLR